jgi:hypothetical protein
MAANPPIKSAPEPVRSRGLSALPVIAVFVFRSEIIIGQIS